MKSGRSVSGASFLPWLLTGVIKSHFLEFFDKQAEAIITAVKRETSAAMQKTGNHHEA